MVGAEGERGGGGWREAERTCVQGGERWRRLEGGQGGGGVSPCTVVTRARYVVNRNSTDITTLNTIVSR